MKMTIRLFIVSVLISGLASCDFLDENMNTHYSEEDIFGSEMGLEAFVTGCYSAYAYSGFHGGPMNEWFSPASTLVHWGISTTPLSDAQKRWVECLNLTQYSKSPYNKSMFSSLYAAIYKCNKLIAELPESPVDHTYKNQIEAEARFLRAQSYFHIVRRWGNAPLHLDPSVNLEQTNGPRENFWKIYGAVIEDLNFAESNGRSYDVQAGIAGLGSGRICSHAATALKSLVYLTIGTLLEHSQPNDNFWVCSNDEVFAGFAEIGIESARDAFEKALQAAKEVMPETTTTASPYRLADNYAQLFRWTDPEDFQLRERIFVIPSTSEVGASQLATWSLPGSYNNTASNTYYGRFRPSRYVFYKWCETYGGELGSGAAANVFVGCPDPRLDASLIYGTYRGKDNAVKICYPNAGSINSGARDYAFPYFKKYYDPKYDATAGYADLYVMRLAEVYLIAAEACANLCATPGDNYGQEAIGYVNKLLARARKSTADGVVSAQPADWSASAIGTKEELIVKIFWERAFEMIGEQHEYFDTHRMGAKWLSDNVTQPHNAFLLEPEQAQDNGNNPGYTSAFYGTPSHTPIAASTSGDGMVTYPEVYSDVRKGLICAFPNDELVYNASLSLEDQNPYEVFWE